MILLSTCPPGLARAAADRSGAWRVATRLPEHMVNCLAVDRRRRGRVFAGTQGAGVWRSDDAGDSWRHVGLADRTVKAIAMSAVEPDVLYAGTKPPWMFVSRDAGATWTEFTAFRKIPGRWHWFSPAEKPFTAYVQAIATSPTDPNRVVVGIEAGATVMTADGGATWTRHLRGSLIDCHSLAFHQTDGNCVYEGGGSGGGAAFSRDGGRTWSKASGGLDRHYGWAVAADPADASTWYVSVSPGAFKAHSARNAQACIFRRDGEGWTKLAGGLPDPLPSMPYALLTDPAHPKAIVAGLANGEIWQSSDRGDTWQRLPVTMPGIHRALVAVHL